MKSLETREEAIPWFLIAKEAMRGVSIQKLSERYKVPAQEIQRHLDKAIAIDPRGIVRVRNNAEISQASARARNDLVTVLQEAIEELVRSRQPRLNQLAEFSQLLSSAAQLFQWPRTTVMRLQASALPVSGYGSFAQDHGAINGQNPQAGVPTEAVNLALIATTPEQLALLAREQREREVLLSPPDEEHEPQSR